MSPRGRRLKKPPVPNVGDSWLILASDKAAWYKSIGEIIYDAEGDFVYLQQDDHDKAGTTQKASTAA